MIAIQAVSTELEQLRAELERVTAERDALNAQLAAAEISAIYEQNHVISRSQLHEQLPTLLALPSNSLKVWLRLLADAGPDGITGAWTGTGLGEAIGLAKATRERLIGPLETAGLVATIDGTRAARYVITLLCDSIPEQQERKSRAPRAGFVYLLQSSVGFFKIGRTVDPENRLRTFGIKLPFDVQFEHVIPTGDMLTLEKRLHETFAAKRINGEWFDLAPADVEYIKSLDGAV